MSDYFNRVPDFEYVSRLPDAKISDYITVKNLFKRGKLREDIFENLAIFTKYQINGNDRPDTVADDFYGDSQLDWLVLLSNNIINVATEWPMSQSVFDEYLLDKYGSYQGVNAAHHYETTEVKNSEGIVLLAAGNIVDSNYSFSYSDLGTHYTVNPVQEITNYQYEDRLQEKRRNIYLLKPRYLQIALDDLEILLTYEKGSSQYVTESLKRADNIRLFQ